MIDEIVSFETAKLAEERGFMEYINAFYVKEDTGNAPWQKEGSLVYFEDHLDYDCCPNHDVPHDKMIPAPTQSLLQRWLREVHYVVIFCDFDKDDSEWRCSFYDGKTHDELFECFTGWWHTYEQALESGLKKALKLSIG